MATFPCFIRANNLNTIVFTSYNSTNPQNNMAQLMQFFRIYSNEIANSFFSKLLT